MQYFAIVKKFEKFEIFNVSNDTTYLSSQLKKLVEEQAIDSVGKKNFTKTLCTEWEKRELSECPEGYVMRYAPAEDTSYFDNIQINVYYNKIESGYLYGNTVNTTYMGHYAIMPVGLVYNAPAGKSNVDTRSLQKINSMRDFMDGLAEVLKKRREQYDDMQGDDLLLAAPTLTSNNSIPPAPIPPPPPSYTLPMPIPTAALPIPAPISN